MEERYMEERSANGAYVVGPQFCDANLKKLLITVSSRSKDGFTGSIVSDATGTVFLRVKEKYGVFSREKQLVEDACGNTLLTLQSKTWSWHERLRAFRGNSTENKDMLFSAKTASIFQWKTKAHVFMAANTEERAPDFKLECKSQLKEGTIWRGTDSFTASPLATITKQKKPFKLFSSVKDSWEVDLVPNFDYAFMVALFIILAQFDASRSYVSSGGGASAAAAGGGSC